MAAPAIDNSKAASGLRDTINKGTLNIGDDIKGTIGNIEQLDKSLTKLGGTWSSNISQTAKLGASLGALGSIAVNATFGIANISSAFNKLGGAKSIVDAVYTSVKNLSGISKSLDFSEAILGTKEFAANIKILEETSDSVFNRISTASQIIFDNQSYQKWSIGAVAAYSKVESAAFRLATITTSSEESAISVVGARIKALRELQKETNFATNSTQTLNAQYDIASAGFNSKQAQKSVGSASINLAEVGFANVEGTNAGIVKILSANKNLGDSFRDADKRASQLFATTKVGILTLDQLNSEAAELASTGVGAGVAFEEMATALALVTTQGLSAGEGSTAIKSLVSEIVNNADKAQKALGTLRDEAGQPIQFGFGALKSEGLIKIIERIGKATGGSRDALNNIFSSSEAAKAANALLQSGGENRKNFRETIDEAGTDKGQDKLKQSAKERGETLEGAFRSSFNKSQSAVEDVGSGIGEGVKQNLQDTNNLLGVLATKSSSSFGSFAGSIDGVANKFQAVSGFIGTVFSVVAPLAFFSFLFKNLGRLGETIKKALKLDDGDINVKTLGQKIEDAIFRIAKTVVSKVKNIVEKVNEEIGKVGGEISDKFSGGQRKSNKVQPEVINNGTFTAGTSLFSGGKSVTRTASTGNIFTKLGGGIGRINEVTKPLQNVLGGAAKELGSFALSTGLVGAGLFAVGTVASGAVTAFNAFRNASSIPEVKELADNLKELKGVAGLGDFLKGITDSRTQLKGLSSDAKLLNTVISNLGQSFNLINGNAVQNDVFQNKTDQATALLTSQINSDQKGIKSGEFKAVTEPQKTAKQKIQLGIVLNEEDVQAVKSSFQDQKDLIEKRLAGVQAKIKAEEEKGGIGSRERVQDFQDQFDSLKAQSKEQEKVANTEQKRILLGSQLQRLQSFSSSVPIAVSTSVAFNSSSKAQFNKLKETLDKVFTVDKIDLSKVDAKEFSKLLPQVQGTLSNITVQADIDPAGAVESLKQLTGDIRVMQFVASDPTATKALDEAFKVATDKVLGYNNTITNSYTKLFSTLSSSGAVGGEAVGQATAKSLGGIQKNIEALRASLDAPNISAQDYADRLSKIADLSSEAFSTKNSGQITEELGKRKQMLTFSQGLLEVQKNIVSVFAQESKFGTFSVSLAQAKLAAAEKELAVKQESLSISAREEEITKSNILQSAQGEVGNREKQLQQVLKSGNISAEDARSKFGVNNKIDLADGRAVQQVKDTAAKEVALNTNNLNASQADSNNSRIKISSSDLDKLKKDLFNEEFDKTSQTVGLGAGFTAEERAKLQASNKLNNLVESRGDEQFINSDQVRKGGSEAANALYQKAIAQVRADEAVLKTNIKNAQDRSDGATGASGQLKERVANIDLDGAKRVVKQAEDDLKFTQVANKLKQEVGALAETIARNEAAIDASFAGSQRLLDISKGVGDSFSALGSTAASLFSSSSIGSVFSNIGSKLSDKLPQVLLDANKEVSKATSRLNTVQAVRDKVANANTDAKASGVANPELEKQQKDIEKQLKTARLEFDRDLQYIKQKTVLEGVNAALERFGAIAKEGADKLDKVGSIATGRLDLQGRREASAGQSNQSTRGFTSAVLGLFGQNNPAAQAAQARNEVLGNIEKTKLAKNDASRAGEKELIGLEIQRQQLLTENLMLTNAFTQTQLLGKLVEKISPESGIQVGDVSGVNKVIGDIPKNIADAQAQTNKSLSLNTDTQQFVREDTIAKRRNIDLDGSTQNINLATGNPLAFAGAAQFILPDLIKGMNLAAQQPVKPIEDFVPFGKTFNQTQSQLQGIGGQTRDSITEQAKLNQDFLNKKDKKITNDFADASPNKPQNPNSASNQRSLSVIVNNTISIDGVKTSFGGDNLNKVGAAVGISGDVISKRLNEFGNAFAKLSKEAFGV